MKTKPKPYHNLSAWLSFTWMLWFAFESVKGEASDRFILTLGIMTIILVIQTFAEHLRDLIVYYNEKEE